MKNSKMSPKEPLRHCDPDVSPVFQKIQTKKWQYTAVFQGRVSF